MLSTTGKESQHLGSKMRMCACVCVRACVCMSRGGSGVGVGGLVEAVQVMVCGSVCRNLSKCVASICRSF